MVDFYLGLRWRDSRLMYRDLNKVSSLNHLTLSVMESLWVPKLAFTNALGPVQTTVGNSSVGTLLREGLAQKEDLSQYIESKWHFSCLNKIDR